MELNFNNLVPDQIIKALCNTLIHSLWQGLILAVITGVAIVLTKKSTAVLRYNLMIGFLLLFAIATITTFFIELKPAAKAVVVNQAVNTPVFQLQATNNPAAYAEKPQSIIGTGINYFTQHANTIVLIWFLIICARCVQFAAGLQHIYYLRRNNIVAAGDYWERKVNALADSMGIPTAVSVMQSGIAKIPMMLGHFKPVILIPIGLLTALSEEEVESILIHELAHIRRKDFLVNLLQNLVEIVFFFNPAVLWASALIKSERENCCDDMVVAQTSSKVSYIKALVSCEEYHSAMPAYAMGLGGKKGHFLNRVKRMLSNNNESLNRMEKAVLTICLVSAVIITAAFSKPEHIKAAAKGKDARTSITKALKKNDSLSKTILVSGDTTVKTALRVYKPSEVSEGTSVRFDKSVNRKKYLVYLAKKDGVLYQLNSTYDGKANTYYIDGKPVSSADLTQHQSQFDDIFNRDVPEPANPAAPVELQHNGEKGEIVDNADVAIAKSAKPAKSAEPAEPAGVARVAQVAKQAKAAKSADSAVAAKYLYRLDSMKSMHQGAKLKATNMQLATLAKMKKYAYIDSANQYNNKAAAYQGFAKKREMQAAKEYAAGDADRGKQAISDMMNDGIIKTTDNLSFKLSTSEFVVNGKKQPEDVYQRYRAKYVKSTGHNEWTWFYNFDTAAKSETNRTEEKN